MREYKLVILGDTESGKGSLAVNFLNDFFDKYDPTFDDSYRKQLNYGGETCILEILDTSGTEQFTSIRDLYMKNGQGFLLVYSITSLYTFNDLIEIREQIIRVKDTTNIPIVLVGNKCHLENDRMVTREQGEALAEAWGAGFMECSTHTRMNVDEIFIELVKQIELRVALEPPRKKGKRRSQIVKEIDKTHIELHKAVREGREQKVADIISKKKSLNLQYIYEGTSLLFDAASNGAIFKMLLNHSCVDPNFPSARGWTPLYQATDEGRIEAVKMLLQHPQIDVNKAARYGETPLLLAIQKNNLNIVELLLRHPKIDVNAQTRGGEAPLFLAVQKDNLNMVELLLQHPGINVNAQAKSGETPLIVACKARYSCDIVKLLLQHPKIDVKRTNGSGDPLLLIVFLRNNSDVMEFLLTSDKVDETLINQECTSKATTLLWMACYQGSTLFVDLLLRCGKSVDTLKKCYGGQVDAITPAEIAQRRGYPHITRKIHSYNKELFAARLFLLLGLIHDGYYQIPSKGKCSLQVSRFFTIGLKLHLDLQQVLCQYVYGSPKLYIKEFFLRLACKKLL